MTVIIVGHWEKSWQAPLNEFDLWIHPLREFGIDEIHMTPISGVGIQHRRIKEYHSLDEILGKYSDLTTVYVDESAPYTLQEFEHPENALYVFGKTGLSPYKIYANEHSTAVKIESINNNGGFWSHQAASIILYDRFLKGYHGSNNHRQ